MESDSAAGVGCFWGFRSGRLELLTIDHDAAFAFDAPERPRVLRRRALNHNVIARFEHGLAPAEIDLVHNILGFDDPLPGVPALILAVDFEPDVWIRPVVFGHSSRNGDGFCRVVVGVPMMRERGAGHSE